MDGFIEAHGASHYDKETEIERYRAAFDDIREGASDEQVSGKFVVQVAEEFGHA